MTTRGVPYGNRAPFGGQPNNNSAWNAMSQAPTEAFRTNFSAPAPPRHNTGGSGSFEGGYNNEPPKDKHRIAKIAGIIGLSSVLVVGGAIGFSKMGSDGERDATSTSLNGSEVTTGVEVLSADECASRTDAYSAAAFYNNGLDLSAFRSIDDLLVDVGLKDGYRDSGSSVEVELSESERQQIWDSYQKTVSPIDDASVDLKTGRIIAYGNAVPDKGEYDGRLDEGLKLCVTISSISGSPAFRR